MTEISRFAGIRLRSQLLEVQFEQGLHDRLGRPMFPSRPDPFGYGCAWIFNGTRAGIRDYLPPDLIEFFYGDAAKEQVTQVLAAAEQMMEYLILRGSTTDELGDNPGYGLDMIRRHEDASVARENELQRQLDGDSLLKNKVSDIMMARELYFAVGEALG